MSRLVASLPSLFLGFIAAGVGVIVAFTWSYRGAPGGSTQWTMTAVVVGLMLVYGILVWIRSRTPYASEADGETFYYLGFIYTLATLVATFAPLLNSAERLDSRRVLGFFGLGLRGRLLGGSLLRGGCGFLGCGRSRLRRGVALRLQLLDPGVDQPEPVAGMPLITPLGEAEAGERAIEQVAGIVAGERAARPVGALEPGCQPDDQQPGRKRAEAVDRGIVELRKRRPVLLTELDQPRAERTVVTRLLGRRCDVHGFRLLDRRPVLGRPAQRAVVVAVRPRGMHPRDVAGQVVELDEDVGLPTQLIGHHRG